MHGRTEEHTQAMTSTEKNLKQVEGDIHLEKTRTPKEMVPHSGHLWQEFRESTNPSSFSHISENGHLPLG